MIALMVENELTIVFMETWRVDFLLSDMTLLSRRHTSTSPL